MVGDIVAVGVNVGDEINGAFVFAVTVAVVTLLVTVAEEGNVTTTTTTTTTTVQTATTAAMIPMVLGNIPTLVAFFGRTY